VPVEKVRLAPGANAPKSSNGNGSKINPETLPRPSAEEIKVGAKVWVYNVRLKDWFKGEVVEVDIKADKPYSWKVAVLNRKLTVYSLDHLRLQ
jgi:hypothetical protein